MYKITIYSLNTECERKKKCLIYFYIGVNTCICDDVNDRISIRVLILNLFKKKTIQNDYKNYAISNIFLFGKYCLKYIYSEKKSVLQRRNDETGSFPRLNSSPI